MFWLHQTWSWCPWKVLLDQPHSDKPRPHGMGFGEEMVPPQGAAQGDRPRMHTAMGVLLHWLWHNLQNNHVSQGRREYWEEDHCKFLHSFRPVGRGGGNPMMIQHSLQNESTLVGSIIVRADLAAWPHLNHLYAPTHCKLRKSSYRPVIMSIPLAKASSPINCLGTDWQGEGAFNSPKKSRKKVLHKLQDFNEDFAGNSGREVPATHIVWGAHISLKSWGACKFVIIFSTNSTNQGMNHYFYDSIKPLNTSLKSSYSCPAIAVRYLCLYSIVHLVLRVICFLKVTSISVSLQENVSWQNTWDVYVCHTSTKKHHTHIIIWTGRANI